ncbi:MAG: hypothetical protein KGZ57_01230 [Dethiobacter sp.]|nr:hypothetical protein [Dethiobacter sp.]MCL5981617.1 hypothetical protein [Bacillota bacterium]
MGLRPQDWTLLALVFMATLFWLFRKRRRVRGKRPDQGSAPTVQLLESAGYKVLKVKPAVDVQMDIGENSFRFELKSDYLVARSDGRRYLVCVYRDGKGMRLQSKMWRNALLRDVLAFRVAGIVVLNMEKETLQQVSFRV